MAHSVTLIGFTLDDLEEPLTPENICNATAVLEVETFLRVVREASVERVFDLSHFYATQTAVARRKEIEAMEALRDEAAAAVAEAEAAEARLAQARAAAAELDRLEVAGAGEGARAWGREGTEAGKGKREGLVPVRTHTNTHRGRLYTCEHQSRRMHRQRAQEASLPPARAHAHTHTHAGPVAL